MKIKFLLLSSLFLGATSLKAQEGEKNKAKEDLLEEVVVVASRKPTKISDIPGTVWVVPQKKLQNLVATGVPIKEMLGQLVPSMDIGSQGRTNFGQNMRGRAMLVMIDGVSLNSLRGVSRQLDAIDPFNIERIEVLSGASSIYGGNATGGIINIVTKTLTKNDLSGETKLSYRSGFVDKEEGDLSVAQSLGIKDEKAYIRLGVAFQKNGGVFGADEKQVFTDITQTDLQYNKSIDVMATAGYKFNANHSISILGQYYNSKFDGDRALSLGTNFGAVLTRNPKLLEMKNGFSSDKTIGTQRYMGIISYRGKNILGGQDLHLQFATRGEELGFYPFPSILKFGKKKVPFTSSSEQNTYYKGVKLVLNKNWENGNITYGVDADFENFEAYRNIYDVKTAFGSGGLLSKTIATSGRYPEVNSASYAGYLQTKVNILPTLTLNGGVRYQHNDVDVDDFVGTIEQVFMKFGVGKSADIIKGGNSTYNVFLGNAGLLFKPNTNHQVWGTFSQGAQLADPAKLYGVGKYGFNPTNANWDLKKSVNINDTKLQGIVTSQFELGYRAQIAGFKAQIAGFYSNSDKSIKVDTKGNLTISVVDLNLRNMGVEAEASYTMDNGFFVGANTLLINSEVEQNDKWVKQSIFTASPSKVLGYVGFQKNNFSVRLQNQQTFDLKDNDKHQIDGYNVTDANIAYKTSLGKFSVGIQNVLNTDYQTIWSKRAQVLYGRALPLPELFHYKGRGRTFTVSYNLEF